MHSANSRYNQMHYLPITGFFILLLGCASIITCAVVHASTSTMTLPAILIGVGMVIQKRPLRFFLTHLRRPHIRS
jgi:hypothetical protein